MKKQLELIRNEFLSLLENVVDTKDLEEIRISFLGKRGKLKEVLKQMGKLTPEERPLMGQLANEIRDQMEDYILERRKLLSLLQLGVMTEREKVDITMPGKRRNPGSVHPTSKIIQEIVDIFVKMGFTPFEGPEIETVYYNFDALNTSPHHPSRSESDTFYFDEERVLRTHTSPVQIRTMKVLRPPIRMISVGRCFRNDEFDATHSPMFYQMEGLVVSEDTTMAELKGVLETFVLKLFGKEIKSVFRPHNFPFTEPSAEVDISCFKCNGEGCRFCSYTGYIEILGCGMVHPNVLKEGGIDPEKYKGFAFGMGLDRITMLKYEIDDIRLLYENDRRFIRQFRR